MNYITTPLNMVAQHHQQPPFTLLQAMQLKICLSCTSIVGNRLRKCIRVSTPLGGVQLYLGGVQLHSHSFCAAHDGEKY